MNEKPNVIEIVIFELLEAGFKEEAKRLEEFQVQMNSSDKAKAILGGENIIAFCHPKAWGDLNMVDRSININSMEEWDIMLDRLKKYTKKIIKNY